MRNFENWIKTFRKSISTCDYYVDFFKVEENVKKLKLELSLLNMLVGSQNIKEDFKYIYSRFPDIIKVIPILLAIRDEKILINDNGLKIYDFENNNKTIDEYIEFIEKIGLFDFIKNNIKGSIMDYVYGIEVGLDSNARKNRGGKLMENLVEKYLYAMGLEKNINYFKEMYISDIEKKWNYNLNSISNLNRTEKRFDFVIALSNKLYLIEVNFYNSSGSKLNEVSRSYKLLSNEIKKLKDIYFVWITDGEGWKGAKNNLKEVFGVLDTIYNIKDLEDGKLYDLIGKNKKHKERTK